jgi:GTP-binding protein
MLMKPILFEQGEFVASALHGSQFPILRSLDGRVLPEVALVGRSNVGKSSLINHLLGSTGLARVSSTPGKTQTINFFAIDQKLAFVDLPGYGYAKVPKQVRNTWAQGLNDYFQNREPLRLILLLIDCRRSLTEEDLKMATWSAHHRKPLLIVFTKSDKLSPKELDANVSHSLSLLSEIDGLLLSGSLVFSIHNRRAKEQLVRAINSFLKSILDTEMS